MVERIDGDYLNVVGLPLERLKALLKALISASGPFDTLDARRRARLQPAARSS